MDRTFKHWQAFISSVLLSMSVMSFSVRAAPPILKTLQSNHVAATDGSKAAVAGSGAAAPVLELPRHLDLRLPVEATAYRSEMEPLRFAPMRGTGMSGAAISDTAIAAGGPHARIMGNVEAFAQRFRREGLPVARLWENHSALVSLGLNGKGKPGLWLVQKTH
jgi:hypothetical protein